MQNRAARIITGKSYDVKRNDILQELCWQVFLIVLFTACNILINEINVLLICEKTLCVKNKVLSCSTFFIF